MDFILSYFDVLPHLPRWYIGAFLGTTFLVYYLQQVVKQPILACSNGKFRHFLEENIPLLKEKYWPTLWCFESRAQTIFASLLRSKLLPDLKYRREILHLSDGGQVGLDWLEEGCAPNSPIIIILPGLTGASQADYIKCLAMSARRLGIRIVVFNNRGMGGITLKTPRTYCAANIEDLAEVVAHVRALHPNARLAASGISMGGMILGNYLAKEGPAAKKVLSAAMLISVPWNAKKGTESIEKPILNLLLNRHLCDGLCKTVVRMQEQVGSDDVDLESVLKSRTIREFDTNFTVKAFGYRDVDDYYEKAGIHDKLHKIEVPLLCLSAADDPFQPYEAIPVEAANESRNVAIVITARGGHIGFLEGLFPAYEGQYMGRLFFQFFSAVFKEGSDFMNSIEDSD